MKTNQDYIIKYIFGAKTKSRVKTNEHTHYGSKVVPRLSRPYIYGAFSYVWRLYDKKLIFDLDNTLIMWKDEYVNALKETLKQHNISEDGDYIDSLIDKYEKYFNKYNKVTLLNYINENIKSKVDMNFIEDFLYNIGFMSEPDGEVIDTLEYLSKKYELVVLTNWFTEPQTNRLKKAKIDKYFKHIYGGEEIIKPNKEAFIKACGSTPVEECIMIGDNYNVDIMGAHNVFIKPIFMNPKDKINKENFTEIKTISELKNIL